MKLVDELNTKYITENFTADVTALSNLKDEELDIAGARFTPKVAGAILSLQKAGINIVDSVDDNRNKLLQFNMAKMNCEFSDTLLPIVGKFEELSLYIKSLNKDAVYRPDSASHLSIALAVLISMLRPNIQMDISTCGVEIFDYVSSVVYANNLKGVVNSTNDYVLLYDNAMVSINIMEKNLDKLFATALTGETTWRELVGKYRVLPAYFGTMRLDKNEDLWEIWKVLYAECTLDIQTLLLENKSLYDYLEEIINDE